MHVHPAARGLRRFVRRLVPRAEPLEPRTLLAFAPAGIEFRVNTATAGDQGRPDVAVDADGDAVAVWQSRDQDGSSDGVYAQRFTAASAPAGEEFRVNSLTAGPQRDPRVSADDAGDFVVTWTDYGPGDPAGDVYARRYNAAGDPQGDAFRVNATRQGAQYHSDVAADPAGDVLIVWQSGGNVVGQFYGAAGAPVGGEFQVNTSGTGRISGARVAAGAGGRFLVTWQTQDTPPGAPAPAGTVRGRRFDATGTPAGDEFVVAADPDTLATDTAADFDGNGNFVIAWDAARAATGSAFS